MIDTLSIYNHLRRPALLFKATQIALKSYRRDIKLPQLLGDTNPLPTPLDALDQLLEIESEHNLKRQQRGAEHHISAHLDVLIAMTAEAQSSTAAITPKNQERLLSCAQYTRQEPRLSPDQAVVFDSWPSDTRPEHWPRS